MKLKANEEWCTCCGGTGRLELRDNVPVLYSLCPCCYGNKKRPKAPRRKKPL